MQSEKTRKLRLADALSKAGTGMRQLTLIQLRDREIAKREGLDAQGVSLSLVKALLATKSPFRLFEEERMRSALMDVHDFGYARGRSTAWRKRVLGDLLTRSRRRCSSPAGTRSCQRTCRALCWK